MAQITRENALSLLASQNIREIIQEATPGSAALSTFRTIRMSAATSTMPVLSALPTAGFVGELGDDETDTRKPLTTVEWGDKELVAREIAVVVAIHENVLADSDYDIFQEVRPLVAEEFGRVLDRAVFFGVNKPAAWTDLALVPGAIDAGNYHVAGTSGNANPDLADDVNEAFGLVEADGFDVNVAYTGRFLRKELRGLRDDNGQPIYLDNVRGDGAAGQIYGQDLNFVTNGAWNKDAATILVGDRRKAILGIRQDITVKVLTEATLEREDSSLIHLAQDDMVGLRFKMRVAYAVATPLTRESDGDPYPFAVVTPTEPGS